MLIRAFQVLAVVLMGMAAYFYSEGDKDLTFVSTVLAACAFFLSIRSQIKGRLDARREQEKNSALQDDEVSG